MNRFHDKSIYVSLFPILLANLLTESHSFYHSRPHYSLLLFVFFQTYASNILVAINPYENIVQLYGSQQMKNYDEAPSKNLPPHIYAIGMFGCVDVLFKKFIQICAIFFGYLAKEVENNLRFSKKGQSILITGVSGSGKTESTRHVVDFLCRTSKSIVDSFPVIELFGNARTRENANSSRFCKFIEVRLYYSIPLISTHTKFVRPIFFLNFSYSMTQK